MLTSRKAVFLLIVTVMLILFSIILPAVTAAQAAPSTVTLSPLALQGSFILNATHIDSSNARLQTLSDPLQPIFSFESSTIQGLQIIGAGAQGREVDITSSGQTVATAVAIKTAAGFELSTALKSFVNKADLLVLLAGGTVPHLEMTNVSLVITTFLHTSPLTVSGLNIAFPSSSLSIPTVPNISAAMVIAMLTPKTVCSGTPIVMGKPTPTPIPTGTPPPTCTGTPTVTPTLTPTATVTPTATLTPPCIKVSATTLNFAAQQGGANPPVQTITLSNLCGTAGSWLATSNVPWLTVNPAKGGMVPSAGTITVSAKVSISGLAAKAQVGTLTLTLQGTHPVPVTVNLAIQPTPTPTLTPTATATLTPTLTPTPTPTPTPTVTPTPTPTPTPSPTRPPATAVPATTTKP